ncbi:MAG: hypothetical protein KAI57_03305 [Candidatus Pacebacteria bacterium]|nr:hypothetical protein [Candidatus Paceibacterota bacterium]
MNKNKILPIAGVILLICSIVMAVYFKTIENKIQKEAVNNSEQNIENKVEEKIEIIDQEQGTVVNQQDGLENTEIVEIEGLETIEEDLLELDSLINDPILDDIDADLNAF